MGLAIFASLVVSLPSPAIAAGPLAQVNASPAIKILSHTFTAIPGEAVIFRLEVGANPPKDYAISVALGSPMETRRSVSASIDGEEETRFRISATERLDSLTVNADGTKQLNLRAIYGTSAGTGSGNIAFPGDGVYHASIEIRRESDQRGPVLASAQTWLSFAGRPAESPLSVAIAWPIGGTLPGRNVDGVPTPELIESAAPGGRLRRLSETAAASPIPLSLNVTPETISDLAVAVEDISLAAGARTDAAITLDSLRVAARKPGAELIAVPYARPPASIYADPGFASDLTSQAALGRAVTIDGLGLSPTADIAIAPAGPLDTACIERLTELGASRIVVDDALLKPDSAGEANSANQPFLLKSVGDPVAAIASDHRLSARLGSATTQSSPVVASKIMAELAAVHFESRGSRQGIVVAPASWWDAPVAVTSQLLGGIAGSPLFEPVSVGTAFSELPLATGRRRTPLLRETLGEKPPPVPAAVSFAVAKRSLEGYRSLLLEENRIVRQVQLQILAAEGEIPLSDGGDLARQLLDTASAQIDAQIAAIRIPVTSGITLTSRDGVMPLRLENGTDDTVRIALDLDSEQLRFPDHAADEAFLLAPPGETREFRVIAGTTGVFPVKARITSPDGSFVVAETRLSVRSTGASGAALLITVGAAGFLALWWSRELLRSRRDSA